MSNRLPRKWRLTARKEKNMGNGRAEWEVRESPEGRESGAGGRPGLVARYSSSSPVNRERIRSGSIEHAQRDPEDEERDGGSKEEDAE